MLAIESPYPQFFDLDGRPLDAGYVYIGVENQNPETEPITVYWDEELTQPAAQPLRTRNGYLTKNGAMAQVYVGADHSMTVRNSRKVMVFYAASSKSFNVSGQIEQLRIDLAAAGGADKIGFQQAGAGAILQTLQEKVRKDFLDATDYGEIDTTGTVLATDVLNRAFERGAELKKSVRLPAGVIATGALAWPAGLPGIFGAGASATTLKAVDTYADFTPLLAMSAVTDFVLEDLCIDVDQVAYPRNWGIQLLNCQEGKIERVRFPRSGSAAIRGVGCQDITIRKVRIASFLDLGIAFADSAQSNERLTIDDCVVNGTGTQTSHNISIVGGGGHTVANCTTDNSANGFGVSLYKCTGSHITGNTFSGCRLEGCNMQDCSWSTITQNTVRGHADSTDMGISLFGDPSLGGSCIGIIVANNSVYFVGASGIGFAANVNNCLAIGNQIHNCNQNDQVLSPNFAGVLFYGLGCNSNAAIGNHIFDTSAKMKYGTNEWNDGTGSPLANYFFDNSVFANGLTAEWNTISTFSRAKAVGWKAYTPVSTTTGGTGATFTVNSAEFKPDGDQIHWRADVSQTAAGGSGAVQIPLPAGFPAVSNGGIFIGKENGVSQVALDGIASGAAANVTKYDGTYPGANGARFVLSGSYRLQ